MRVCVNDRNATHLFTDMKTERNTLSQKSYPELSEFCQQFNLDFKTVDMRWGVTDEAGNDHKTSFLCIKEIEICQKVSVGPNYVVSVFNKTNTCSLLSSLPNTYYTGKIQTCKLTSYK